MKIFGVDDDEPILILLLVVVGWFQGMAGLWALLVALSVGARWEAPLVVMISALVWLWMAEVLRLLRRR